MNPPEPVSWRCDGLIIVAQRLATQVPMGPPDIILGIVQDFKDCTAEGKVSPHTPAIAHAVLLLRHGSV